MGIDWDNNLGLHTYRGGYLNYKLALVLISFGILMGITGFMVLEDYTFREAFYMTVITIYNCGVFGGYDL